DASDILTAALLDSGVQEAAINLFERNSSLNDTLKHPRPTSAISSTTTTVSDSINETAVFEDDDDPFSTALKELDETNRRANEIIRKQETQPSFQQTIYSPLSQFFHKPKVSSASALSNRPIILHGLHSPLLNKTPTIIRLAGNTINPSPLLSSQTPLPCSLTVPSINVPSLSSQPLLLNSDLINRQVGQVVKFIPAVRKFDVRDTRQPLLEQDEEAAGEDEEEMAHAETYSDYMPAKLRIGKKHPDPVVETSSLSSVELPNIYYELHIPQTTIESSALSALQLETIVYACQRHNTLLTDGTRAGDGAGVGKGRTIAGIIYENYILGRKKSLWLSVSNDLKYDAQRDLSDIGAQKISVHPLNKFKYDKLSSPQNGSVKRGIIFATYSSLIGESQNMNTKLKYNSRMKQLLHWLGEDFDGVIVFDECHKAKNLVPTTHAKSSKTGLAVLDLQARLPKARVIYASATGASEPRNMAYMTRLGLWGKGTSFTDFSQFIQAIERRGVGAMELIAMDMKLRGMYIARQLSFSGVNFSILEVPLEHEYVKTYDESVKLWIDIKEKLHQALELSDTQNISRKHIWAHFWLSHQRFFKYLCMACKVQKVVDLTKQATNNNKCVVIGLQSTGEAKTLEQLDEFGELNDFVSTAKGVIQSFVDKHFPTGIEQAKTMSIFDLLGDDWLKNDQQPSQLKTKMNTKRKRNIKETSTTVSSSSDNDSDDEPFSSIGQTLKRKPKLDNNNNVNQSILKQKFISNNEMNLDNDEDDEDDDDDDDDLNEENITDNVLPVKRIKTDEPKNEEIYNKWNMSTSEIVDALFRMKSDLLNKIDALGRRLPANTLDELIDQLGGPHCVAEMTGRKGRIIQNNDGRVSYETRSESDVPLELLNVVERERFMRGEKLIAIISEAASSGISLQADRRCQNQRRRVHVTLELSWSADRAVQQFELAGEKRFASTVAKRLECLGALTHGDRRATETRDLSRFNIDNKYGKQALENVIRSICGIEKPLAPFPVNDTKNFDFVEEAKKALANVGLITQINELHSIYLPEKDYNIISRFLNRILGIRVDMQNYIFHFFSDVLNALVTEARRNGTWDLDLGAGEETVSIDKTDVFVMESKQGESCVQVELFESRLNRRIPILAVALTNNNMIKKCEELYRIYRPNTGLQNRHETLESLRKKYKKVLPRDAQSHWDEQYGKAATMCTHMFRQGSCPISTTSSSYCEVGLRSRRFHVLSGSVLTVWNCLEHVLGEGRMQMIRIKTSMPLAPQKIVGCIIPKHFVHDLIRLLEKCSIQTYVKK
ncbi:unnamed protein product, partial [Didymodactylos carnosus]